MHALVCRLLSWFQPASTEVATGEFRPKTASCGLHKAAQIGRGS
jgi:hypothetical protein